MTSKTVTIHEGELKPINVATLQARVQLVHQALQTVMQDGTHYGTIPGTNKPSLYKAGSEILLTMFQISVEPEVEDLSTGDKCHYRVRAVGRHQGTGTTVGIGIGEASSEEEKYCWREAVCPEEFDAAPADKRRIKWKKGYQGGAATSTPQVRTNPADVANTVLKMAKKRAQIDLSLTATGASDIFTQDMADDEGGEPGERRPAAQTPRAKATSEGKPGAASPKQIGLIRARAANSGITEAEICKHLVKDSLDELEWREVNPLLAWIDGQAKGNK